MMSGFAFLKTSMPSPHLSSVPVLKFSITTSLFSTSSRNSFFPSSLWKSSVTHFLLRPIAGQRMLTPSFNGPMARNASPLPGISTLMTSAPKSAISPAAHGAAITVAMSKTLIPSNACMLHSPLNIFYVSDLNITPVYANIKRIKVYYLQIKVAIKSAL